MLDAPPPPEHQELTGLQMAMIAGDFAENLGPADQQNEKRGLRLIAGFKFFYGVLLAISGAAMLHLVGKNLDAELSSLAGHLGLDTRSYYLRWLMNQIPRAASGQLIWLGAGTFVYAALAFIEAAGLYGRRLWAQWLTILDTGSFIPVEIYQLCRGFNGLKLCLLVLNVFVVLYLACKAEITPEPKRASGR